MQKKFLSNCVRKNFIHIWEERFIIVASFQCDFSQGICDLEQLNDTEASWVVNKSADGMHNDFKITCNYRYQWVQTNNVFFDSEMVEGKRREKTSLHNLSEFILVSRKSSSVETPKSLRGRGYRTVQYMVLNFHDLLLWHNHGF